MTDGTLNSRQTAANVTAMLVMLYAVTFFLGALLHLGVTVGGLAEPVILPAAIVESLCGFGLAISAFALLTRRSWAWRAAVGAQGFSLAGVLLGVVALAAGGGPRTELNDAYHLTMLVLLSGGLAVLLTPAVKRSLGA